MESTSAPETATAPIFGQALVEFVRTQRRTAGYIVGALAVVLLASTVYLALKAYRTNASADKTADKASADNPLDPEKPLELPKSKLEIASLNQGDYNVGWVACLLGFAVTALGAAWLFVSPPPPGEEKQRSELRQGILILGGVLGIIVMLAALVFFYRWSDSLANWLDKGEVREARWALIPILMGVVGTGLIFLAIQPARAEERNNSPIRKLVYAANLVLTSLLLFVALVVANVFFSMKVPNKLDVTETGFYSISDSTKNLLQRLDQPINVYAVMQREESGDRVSSDIRQLLLSCQDASDGKFKLRFLSKTTDKAELGTLRSKYPQFDLVLDQRNVGSAILLATGEGERRHVVIPDSDFIEVANKQFVGESKLYKEISILGDSDTKPIVYFTQSNGELDISGSAAAPPDRSATKLKAYLEKNYLDIRPLKLAAENPTVPDDTAVLVIGEPRVPYSEAAIDAIRKYMNNPTKKGKLIFFSGALAGPDGKMLKTGIESLLAEMNISLGNQFIYTYPTEVSSSPFFSAVGFSNTATKSPIFQSLMSIAGQGFPFGYPREILPLTSNPAFQSTPLLLIDGLTWLEDEKPADLGLAIRELRQNAKIRALKKFSDNPRSVSVTVTEGNASRAVAFGNSFFVSDDLARQVSGNQAPTTFDLFGVTVDWLRDKKSSVVAANIEAKKYVEYTFPSASKVDNTRLVWLPLGLGMMTIVGLGAGVWVIRRK